MLALLLLGFATTQDMPCDAMGYAVSFQKRALQRHVHLTWR